MRLMALSATYRRSLLQDMTRFLVLFLVGIEAIYLSDKLLTDLLLAAVNYGNSMGFLLRCTVLAIPEILGLGLPLALAVSVFVVLLQRRETGDFVTLAQVGFAPSTMIGLSLGLGGLGFVAALVIGGVVAPLAEYRLGLTLHQAQYEVLSTGDPGIRNVLNFDGATAVYHRNVPNTETSARILLYIPGGAGEMQVITAHSSQLRFDMQDGGGALFLTGARITDFNKQGSLPLSHNLNANVSHMVYSASGLAIPPYHPRDTVVSTLTLNELLALPPQLGVRAQEAALRIVLAAVLAMLSPLVAATAMGLTRNALVPVAGPVGAGLLLAGGFAISEVSLWLTRFSLWESIGLALGGGVVVAVHLSLVMARLGDALLTPAQLRL